MLFWAPKWKIKTFYRSLLLPVENRIYVGFGALHIICTRILCARTHQVGLICLNALERAKYRVTCYFGCWSYCLFGLAHDPVHKLLVEVSFFGLWSGGWRPPRSATGGNLGQLPLPLEFENDCHMLLPRKIPKKFARAFGARIKYP